MNDVQFRAFLNLLMVSDPWPLTTEEGKVLTDLANRESERRGYGDWYQAYHEYDKPVLLPEKVEEEPVLTMGDDPVADIQRHFNLTKPSEFKEPIRFYYTKPEEAHLCEAVVRTWGDLSELHRRFKEGEISAPQHLDFQLQVYSVLFHRTQML